MLARTVFLGCLLASSAFAVEKPRIVVLQLTTAGGTEAQTAAAFSDALAQALASRGLFDVVSARDVSTLIGVQRQKELLGCSEDSKSCLAELSGALNARFIMSGTLAKLGDAYQLTLTTVDSERAQPLGRSTHLAATLKELQAVLPWAVSEATATPSPAPPSRAGPITLLAVGGAAILVGAAIGVEGVSQDAALQAEISNPRLGALSTRQDYMSQAQTPAMLKTIALSALVAGGVLAAGGALWLALLPSSGGSSGIALVPTGFGAALAGEFP